MSGSGPVRAPSWLWPLLVGQVVIALLAARLLPPAVLVLSLPFLVMLARKPVLRRLALRNISRRPRETTLVLLGSMLGTAIITGSMIVGDTLDASITRTAFTQLGPIDHIVSVPDIAALPEVEALTAQLPDTMSDGSLPFVMVGAAAVAGDGSRAEPHATLVEFDVDKARRFGGDLEATGMKDVVTPGPGETVVNEDLAAELDVVTGDTVTTFAYGREARFTVVGTMPRLGVAGFSMSWSSESTGLLVASGTIAALSAERPAGAAPPVTGVAVSNAGGVLEGARLTDEVSTRLRQLIGDRPLGVDDTKQDLLDDAKASGDQFTQIFGSIGAFSVLAGTLLLVNIFVMLAQERKTELGMLRAVGLRRASLVGSFSLEGWMYALGSSAIGTVVGLGVGRLIVLATAGIFGARDGGLEIGYHAELGTIHLGFLVGFLISLVTVVLTSSSIARLNVIRAIRDLPEPDADRARRSTLVLGAFGVLAGSMLFLAGASGGSGIPILVGPGLVGLGIVPLLRRFLGRRLLVSGAAIAVLAWSVVAFDFFPDAFAEDNITVFVFQGVLLTGAAVALVSQNQDAIGAFVRRLGGGSRSMALRLGLAYPLARRFRTGMTLTMYSLVVFTITIIATFSHLFGGQIDEFSRDISGGFHVRMFTNSGNPAPASEVAAFEGVAVVAPITAVGAEFATARQPKPTEWGVGTFDRAFVEQGAPTLADRGSYADDRAAYEAVLTDPTLIMPTEFFLQSGGGPPGPPPEAGDVITLRNPRTGVTRQLTVAAVARSGFGNSLPLIAPALMTELFGDRPATNSMYIAADPGVDADELAARLNAAFLEYGADAASFREQIRENLAQQQGFFRLMQGYLSLGLLVGIAGLGVVMVRAVRERRRQVGVLRALGFPSRVVRRAFVAESAFVALEGIVLGMSLALITAWRLSSGGGFGEELGFSVPWGSLVVLLTVTFLASLAATAAPAQQASRIRPAVALRITD